MLHRGLEALINATYSKLGYVKSPFESDGEVERILRKGGEAQTFEDESPNALAHAGVHAWLSERDRFKQRVSLRALLNHFGSAPYGWTDLDVVGVLGGTRRIGQSRNQPSERCGHAQKRLGQGHAL